MLKLSCKHKMKGYAFRLICKISLMLNILAFSLIIAGVLYMAKDKLQSHYIEIEKIDHNLIATKGYNDLLSIALQRARDIAPTANSFQQHSIALSYIRNQEKQEGLVSVVLDRDIAKRIAKETSSNSSVKTKAIRSKWNWNFFLSSDSFFPNTAGIKSALTGSLGIIIIMLLVIVPMGIGSAIYLEEFAKKNYINSLIEVSINNLAAVPSIIYGILGLMVFVNYLGAPRSSMLAGGLVLGVLSLPSMIIVARQAIREVPYHIKQAAYGLGATKVQVIFHHTIPYALPSIITGKILNIARALGESAPLLVIGMAAFVYRAPGDFLDASTALPLQIFSWSKSPQEGFIASAALGVVVLLLLLFIFNLLASYIRDKFKVEY